MADPAAKTLPTEGYAAIVSERLTALVLNDEDTKTASTTPSLRRGFSAPDKSPSASTPPGSENGENTAPSNRRPLFSSMREALESSGQMKEEPGGYVIKRHSSRQQQNLRSTDRVKYRHVNQRAGKSKTATPSPEDEADAAGYTVIRRRASCDESALASASASASASSPSYSGGAGRRTPRASTASRANKKPQPPQRPRRGSLSALPQRSSLLASMAPPSSSVPPGFQPRAPPGLTPAASGWVVKAAAPAEHAGKIAEPPVEALWPDVKEAPSAGWAVATPRERGAMQAQAWPAAEEGDRADDDDLLARLGVTL
ncbi:unnamed protein product [Phytophthora lilii]|uniref:Unnamed protein product n=1 Tax=Phytophthora lilii TaxID=2077276 RepID=A0A9W6TBL5_9STRA|nr:unnamed protein product [Phytophthora lilii]